MYVPNHFHQPDPNEAVALIRRVVLGELVTFDGSGLVATPLPMIYDASVATDGALLGHVARANPQWRSFAGGVEALAIFRGPGAYVSPSWYPTKSEDGKVVPTWDYATVHVYGQLVVHDDEAWKRTLVTRLTDQQEHLKDRPWAVSDAPERYVTGLLRGIVGVELRITRMEAKWKLSQNELERNRAGVVSGLQAEEEPEARAVAHMIRALPGGP